jgi:hypothetical protein
MARTELYRVLTPLAPQIQPIATQAKESKMSFTLFASRKSEINSTIASIQSQISQLQQQLANQQSFLQEIGSVEGAAESALIQTQTFLSMVRAIDPSQEAVFWQAMDALKNENLEILSPASDDAAESSPTPDATAPTPEETTTVEVEATEVTETAAESQADDEAEQTVVDTSHHASPRALHKQPAKSLKWLAAQRGIDHTGMKRHEIASALIGQVTATQLQEAIVQTQNVG